MKLFIKSADAAGQIDGSVNSQILSQLPLCKREFDADAIVVPISYYRNYKFNEELREVKKPVVLVDFLEFGWNWQWHEENVLGRGNIRKCPHLDTDEYEKLDKWVVEVKPILQFKRELRLGDRGDSLLPAEFLCYLPKTPIQNKEEFDKRPMEVFNSWGYSHPLRRSLHGDIFRFADDHGIHVIDSWEQDGHFEGNHNWSTIHVPHYLRKHISEIQKWMDRAKICVSLPGAGIRCFRHAEISNSIMALVHDPLCWSTDWVNGVNCIRLETGKEFDGLLEATKRENLHDIYVNAQETLDRYRPERYAKEYVIPNIKRCL